jgi:hypothetical protein
VDQLLEHFMPSLMALKKALPDNPVVFESHFILLSAFIKFKNKKNIEGNIKTSQKEKRLKGDALEK